MEKELTATTCKEDGRIENKYNESLKEFLKPIFQQDEISKNKKMRKLLKTYAQALGIKTPPKEDELKEESKSEKGLKKKKEERPNESKLKHIIRNMELQI